MTSVRLLVFPSHYFDDITHFLYVKMYCAVSFPYIILARLITTQHVSSLFGFVEKIKIWRGVGGAISIIIVL